MAMFNPVKDDTLSLSSIGALLGMYSTNGTWFVMGFGALFLDSDNWRIIGAGIRFTAFEENHMNVGIDIAAGQNDWGIYFRIGEAF